MWVGSTILYLVAFWLARPTASLGSVTPPSSTLPTPLPPPWYLLGLQGNTSLVHHRLADFLLFLRINVASLADSEYERVTVNSVSYTPSLLVNLSFTGRHDVSGLQRLSDREDSLFLLSFVPFHVTSFTSREEILVAKPVTHRLSTPREEEALIYLGVGAATAFILSAGLLVCVLLLLGDRSRVRDREPLLHTTDSLQGRYQDPPQTIYSENFSQDLAREKERLHQFLPLDESLCPITDTEVDFTPRYLREDDRSSWLSDGSIGAIVDIQSDPGCDSFPPTKGFRHNLSTFSEDGSLTGREGRASQLSRSPFYCQTESPMSSPCLPATPPPPPAPLPKHSQRRAVKTPPRPPSRTDSLNPNSKTKARPKSVTPRLRRTSEVPMGGNTRPLSVPAPYHRAGCQYHGSALSTPCPTPTPHPATQEEIDQDVHSILTNLGISCHQ